MASLPKPLACQNCSCAILRRFRGPERWVCTQCNTIVSTRQKPVRAVPGICQKCGSQKSNTNKFKSGKNHCLKCDRKYMGGYRKTSVAYKANRNKPETRKRYQANVKRCIESSPESFISQLYIGLIKPARQHKTRSGFKINPKRLAILNDVQITLDDLLNLYYSQNGRCTLTNIPLEHKFNNINSISIDRIDSDKGYHLDNIHIVCKWINVGKGTHSLTDIKAAIAAVISNAKSKWY